MKQALPDPGNWPARHLMEDRALMNGCRVDFDEDGVWSVFGSSDNVQDFLEEMNDGGQLAVFGKPRKVELP